MARILHLIGGAYHSRLGGRSRFQNYVEKSQHYHLAFSTSRQSNNEKQRDLLKEQGKNWEIHLIPGSWNIPGGFYLSWIFFRFYFVFVARKYKVDIIHVHNANEISMAGGDVAKFLNIPLIFEMHGVFKTAKDDRPRRLKKRNIKFEKKLLGMASFVIVQTKRMLETVVDHYYVPTNRILRMPNVVDTDFFNPVKYVDNRQIYRNKWELYENDIVFLYAGYLNWYNGIPQLIDAFKALKENSLAKLIILGEGDLTDLVISAASAHPERIKYLGSVAQTEIPKIYSAADCSILPRPNCPETQDATPMKLLEAMAMSHVIICTNVEGMTRIVDDKVAVIIPPDDRENLISNINTIANNYENYKYLGSNAREKVIQQLSFESSVDSLDNLYLKILSKN